LRLRFHEQQTGRKAHTNGGTVSRTDENNASTGNPAIPMGPVVFRPCLATGLAKVKKDVLSGRDASTYMAHVFF
jgi:hypothetical protein